MLPRAGTPPPTLLLSAIRATQRRTWGLVLTPSWTLRYGRPAAVSSLRAFSSRKSPALNGPRSYICDPRRICSGPHQINGRLFATSSKNPTTKKLQPYIRHQGSLVTVPFDGNDFPASVQHSRAFMSAATPPKMYTTSFAFFEALWEAGVTHCFVNLGSDHPSIIEAMVKGQREKQGKFPRIITCPNEVSFCSSFQYQHTNWYK